MLLAVGAASLVARAVGSWLAARGFEWVTPTRIAGATAAFFAVAFLIAGVGVS